MHLKEKGSNMLEKVNMPEDVKALTKEEKVVLAQEIRNYIIEIVSKTGGHLASNLGVVELTIALHSCFQFPKDKLIWDVGHQCYVHKILTGRKEKMTTLRKKDGLSGFPKAKESVYDQFDTGHSSTSISAALGMARARDIQKEHHHVIAVIGDGALTGGVALEALNDAGNSKTNLIVILNDNEMSISQNVGGISSFLTKLRTRKFYKKSNKIIKKIVEKIPKLGNTIIKIIQRVKKMMKSILIQNMFFEDIGYTYLGPVDGHDIEKVEDILERAKQIEGPVLVHVITKKGKGYAPAEKNPDKFHGVSGFDIQTGNSHKIKGKDYSSVFGETLVALGKKDEKIVAVTAAMKDGTGLSYFKEAFPDRFFDVGIAEQHALTMCAGMAKAGLKPVVSIYSSFYQRGYDQIIHDICLQKLPVVMCIDRGGIVGNDGETHQGIYDMAFLRSVPNLTIMAPKDFKELKEMLTYALTLKRPVAIRYPRGGESKVPFEKQEPLKVGKAEILKQGEECVMIAIGKMVAYAQKIAQNLEKQNHSVQVINARFLKPMDKQILTYIEQTKKVVTIEDGCRIGGLASEIAEQITKSKEKIEMLSFAYPDEFIEHGSVQEVEEAYGMTVEKMTQTIYTWLEKEHIQKQIEESRTDAGTRQVIPSKIGRQKKRRKEKAYARGY